MSWISDLAGRAENILNKIDQNAANVLQQPSTKSNENAEIEDYLEPSEGIKRNYSSSSLSLSLGKLTPRKLPKNEFSEKPTDEVSVKWEKESISSRRSSNSSRADGNSIISEQETTNAPSIILNRSGFSVEKELAATKIILAEITSERDELQKEIVYVQEQLKINKGEDRIHELDDLVEVLSLEREQLLKDHDELKSKNTEHLKSISELELNLLNARQSLLDQSDKLDWQTRATETASTELVDYKKKAQATLQMKEKVIEELKSNRCDTNESTDIANQRIFNIEIDELRQDNVHLHEELKNVSSQLEYSKEFIQKLEQQIEDRKLENAKLQTTFHDSIRIEQQRSQQLESELKITNHSLTAIREESSRQGKLYTSRLHEKESELCKMRTKMAETCSGYQDANGLENRMQSLTQALVHKQAAIEAVTAERNALRLQLEKVKDQLHHVIVQERPHRAQVINVNDTDDVKAQLPLLLRETPFDTNVARRVKRAYSSLDSAGIRVGVFLRRYPLIRIIFFIYVALLHIWVMFVLLSSTPN